MEGPGVDMLLVNFDYYFAEYTFQKKAEKGKLLSKMLRSQMQDNLLVSVTQIEQRLKLLFSVSNLII